MTYENLIRYSEFAWGPDGEEIYFLKLVYFTSNIKGKDLGCAIYLCCMDADAGNKKEIKQLFTNKSGSLGRIDICKTTRQAVFELDGDLWRVNLDGADLKQLVKKADAGWSSYPSWFPYGEQIVYQEAKKSKSLVIVKIDKNGQNKVYLTSINGEKNEHPVISPDGKTIAYTHYFDREKYKNFNSAIWLMNNNGNNKRELYTTTSYYARYPEWNPNGKRLCVYSNIRGRIIDANTGEELILLEKFKFTERGVPTDRLRWSKKGLLSGHGLITEDWNYVPFNIKARGSTDIPTEGPKDISRYEYIWGCKKEQ